ncbi:uncharacterized protein J8A68_004835 [[Candida] subhashii]|uniref:Mitochondrial group I intron splicing factor CCM1 n=1 Tax=[Candida] subhashii TaxID=561895 RepID=A0A8J5UJD4_9ASCO|nr:uncharacterized protein J8A68_004835 [[Candida] subhashii]KAG7661682.1 hypothetical protein J8A68_004835 [[Candida] subhashii]
MRIPSRIASQNLARIIYTNSVSTLRTIPRTNSLLPIVYPTRNISSFTKKIKKALFVDESIKKENPVVNRCYNEIKEYVDNESMDPNLKAEMIQQNIASLLHENMTRNEFFKVLDLAILHLQELSRNNDIELLPLESSTILFEKVSDMILSEQEQGRKPHLPTFIRIVISHLLKNVNNLPHSTLLALVDLGSQLESFKLALQSLVFAKGEQLPENFSTLLVEYFKRKGRLSLEVFEELVLLSEHEPKLVDEGIISSLKSYIETLYEDAAPETHCYIDLERNIDRVHMLVTNLTEQLSLEKISMKAVLMLFRLNYELLAINNHQESEKQLNRILDYLVDPPTDQKFSDVNDIIFEQNLDDEALAEALLVSAWSSLKYHSLAQSITLFILGDSIKFSPELRLQACAYPKIHEDLTEVQAFETMTEIMDTFENDISDRSHCFDRIIQAASTSPSIEPNGKFVELLTGYFAEEYLIEPSRKSFKYRIDRALQQNEVSAAVDIYSASIENGNTWTAEAQDPTIFKTLNDLIVEVTNGSVEDEEHWVAIYQSVSAQAQSPLNVEAITNVVAAYLKTDAIAEADQCMHKNLPEINRDTIYRLPSDKQYGYKYRKLFDVIHDFIITYKGRPEKAWYFYVALNEFFFLSHETILPALKFFCDNGLLSSALTILKTVVERSQMHGKHPNLPPTREMYMYLLTEFGNKLYEQGVLDIHEIIKMDVNLLESDIELENCILNAYANLQDITRARRLFLSMSTKPKEAGGINEESVQIMVKAYSYNDIHHVQDFFEDLPQFGVVPNYAIYRQYLIAYVYHGFAERAIEVAEEMPKYDLEVSGDALICMYNYCASKHGQQLIADWAEKKHPKEWANVVESGLLIESSGYRADESVIAASSSDEIKLLNE